MKFRLPAALCLAAALLLTGCSSSGEGTDSVEATIPIYQALPLPDIKLDIPETFSKTSSEFYEEYYICNDASIIVTEDKNGPFIDGHEYSINALQQYREIATTVEVLSDEVLTCQNSQVQTLEFRYTLGDNAEADMTAITGFITDGDSMFIITCKSNTATYEQYSETFRAVLTSAMLTTTGK